jgi:hypothetical protein
MAPPTIAAPRGMTVIEVVNGRLQQRRRDKSDRLKVD